MAFEGLTEKLSAAFKKLRSKGRLTEADVKDVQAGYSDCSFPGAFGFSREKLHKSL